MFEPLNALERALVAAATDPAARPAFTRALLESQLFISPAGEPLTDGQLGEFVVSYLPEGEAACVFTAVDRVTEVVGEGARAQGWPGRVLLEQLRTKPVHINPNLEFGVIYSVSDIAEILDGVRHETVAAGTQMLLSHPAERPEALIKALTSALGALGVVKGAWMLQAHRAGEASPSWLLGVDHQGDWATINRAIVGVVAQIDLGGRILEATSLDDSGLSRELRDGIPVVLPKRRKLFGFLKG
jgi:hypothetical protein